MLRQATQKTPITALYARLSKDDEQQGESLSIENQKRILETFARDNGFLNCRFFVDDGWSGANFQRPGFMEMMDCVENGEVKCVITKDLSRMGRNYLQVGMFTEITFPKKGVRFIAINDGVDSAHGDNDLTPLKNLFNEWMVRDTSRKIKAVFRSKGMSDKPLTSQPVYGYLKGEDGHFIIDEEAAPVVRQIFSLCLAGNGPTKIARVLTEQEIPTPGTLEYRRTGSTRRYYPDYPYKWATNTIVHILERKEYLGHTVTAKKCKVSYKSKKTRVNPEDKRYFFPNTHEALVDEETFDLAQKRIATKHRPTKSEEIDLFSGLLFCGDCGYKMYLQQGAGTLERKHAYTCGRYRNRIRTGEVCTTHYIRKSVLKELVLGDIQRVLSYVKAHEQQFIADATEYGDVKANRALREKRGELDKAKARLGELDHLFRKLYEDNALGRLSDQQFTFMVSGYDDEKAALVEKIRGLEKEVSTVTERRDDVGRFVQIVRKYTDVQELSYEIVHEFIDRILVYELDKDTNTRKVEIYYSFVGQVDTGEAHTESVSFFRQIGADVKSYAV